MYCRNRVFVLFCLLLTLVRNPHAQSEESQTTQKAIVTTLFTVLPDSEVDTISYNVEEENAKNLTDVGKNPKNVSEDEAVKSEIESIFNVTKNESFKENKTDELDIDLISNKSIAQNDTIGPEARVSEQDSNSDNNSPAIGPTESAGILAGVVVLIGIVGYIGFVVWRRILQYRYGNSEMLITDDVYDISDLRYFEI